MNTRRPPQFDRMPHTLDQFPPRSYGFGTGPMIACKVYVTHRIDWQNPWIGSRLVGTGGVRLDFPMIKNFELLGSQLGRIMNQGTNWSFLLNGRERSELERIIKDDYYGIEFTRPLGSYIRSPGLVKTDGARQFIEVVMETDVKMPGHRM
jgi:hypothetical protein